MTTKQKLEDTSKTDPADQAKIVLSNIRYHKHKACLNCNLKNAFLDGAFRLQCRECGYRWEAEKIELIGQKDLQSAIDFIALEWAGIAFPGDNETQLQRYADGLIAYLKQVCFWFDDKDKVELYVVRFNILTRLIEKKNHIKTIANV